MQVLKPKDLSRILSLRCCVVIINKIRCKLKLVKVKMWHFVYVNIFCKICMHGFEKNRLRQNYVGLIFILYFDEDQRSFMIVVGFWKILGVYLFIYR